MADQGGFDGELHYDVMVENALRGVVRSALSVAAEEGLPGDHHFYITFRSTHPGVSMPQRLRERYPREMTIVLQFQYWDLEIEEEQFAVTLSFDNINERLVVPFEAVTAFADPSVRFGLQFDAGEDDLEDDGDGIPESASNTQAESGAKEPDSSEDAGKGEGASDDKVVTLDKFRKK